MKRKDNTPFIIAEIGGNHEGDISIAKDLLLQASEAGADSVKFQIYSGDGIVNRLISPQRAAHFDSFALSIDQYFELFELALKNNIDFNASIWNLELLSIFRDCLSFIKIGSGDLTARQFLKEILTLDLPIVLSTGLANYEEIESTICYLESQGKPLGCRDKLSILQCTSMYPIEDEFANLNVISILKEKYPNSIIGYSDHTRGTEACRLAIALGAEILEVHFTDKTIKSDFRDHQVSLDSDEVKSLRDYAFRANKLLGSKEKKLTEIESLNEHHISFRRGLYLNKDLQSGHIIKVEDIISLRPQVGIAADKFDKLVGCKLKKDILAFEPLHWEFLK